MRARSTCTVATRRLATAGRAETCPCHGVPHAACPDARPCIGGCGRLTTAHETSACGYCPRCAGDSPRTERRTAAPLKTARGCRLVFTTPADTLATPAAALARGALFGLADRVVQEIGDVVQVDLVSPMPARDAWAVEARWIFLWSARIVGGAKDWQLAQLLGFRREQLAEWHGRLQDRANRDIEFRDRLDRVTRSLAADTAWKRPIKKAIRQHRDVTDGRRR